MRSRRSSTGAWPPRTGCSARPRGRRACRARRRTSPRSRSRSSSVPSFPPPRPARAPLRAGRVAPPRPLAPPPPRPGPCLSPLLPRERAPPPLLQRAGADRLHASRDRRVLARERPLAPPVVALPPRCPCVGRPPEGSRAAARLVGLGDRVLHDERLAARILRPARVPGPRRGRGGILARSDRHPAIAGRRPRPRVAGPLLWWRGPLAARLVPAMRRGVAHLTIHVARRRLPRVLRPPPGGVVRFRRRMPAARPPVCRVHRRPRRRGRARVAPPPRSPGVHDLAGRGGRAPVVRRARPPPGRSGSLAA